MPTARTMPRRKQKFIEDEARVARANGSTAVAELEGSDDLEDAPASDSPASSLVENREAAAPAPAASAPEFVPAPESVKVWEMIHNIDPMEWNKYLVYIYRVDPQVKNADKYRYIDKFGEDFDEADVAEKHGGGKYQVRLIDRSVRPNRELGQMVFAIDERAHPPKFLPGQQVLNRATGEYTTPAPGAPAAAPAPAAGSAPAASDTGVVRELASVLNRLVDKLDRSSGDQAGVNDLYKKASELTLQMVEKQATRALDAEHQQGNKFVDFLMKERERDHAPRSNGTGHPLLDKLLERAIDRLIAEPQAGAPARSSLEEKILERLVESSDLGALIGGGESGGGWASIFADVAKQLLPGIPGMVQSFLTLKRYELDLKRAAMQRAGGQVPALPAAPAIPPAPAAARGVAPQPAVQTVPIAQPGSPSEQPNPPADAAPAGEQAMFEQVLNDLGTMAYSIYMGDGEGFQVAIAARRQWPELLGLFKPMLARPGAVMEFARSHAMLRTIADDEDFAEFADQFAQELLHPEHLDEEDTEPARGPAPVTNLSTPAAPADPKQPA